MESANARRIVDVAACLGLPEFEGARLLTGQAPATRPVGWVAIIEWPVENFVSPGDLVLTTGVGCDEARLRRMIRQISDSGAAAVCMSVGRGAPHKSVPESLVTEAARSDLPLVELEWRVRFSDLSRAVIQALYAEGYTMPRASGDLPAEFTRALLGPSGVAGIAEALEGVVGAPVIVVDATMAVIGSGPAGTGWIADREVETAVIAAMARHARQATAIDRVAGHRIVTAPAAARDGGVLGWVVAALPDDGDRELTERAVLHAGTAVAIELLREVAAGEAESRARADFVWEVASGSVSSVHELSARAALLGLPLSLGYEVGVGLVEDQETAARDVGRRLRRRLDHPASIVSVRENEILVCLHESEPDRGSLLTDVSPVRLSWGFATGSHTLAGLPQAFAQARTALSVTRALHGAGGSAAADELGAYMLLHSLAADPAASRLAADVLEPLERAHSDLLGTLAVFLDENGNTSAAARRLHLNRHSLIYRLQRIAELTGRDLDSHEQRLLLDLSMRIKQLTAASYSHNPGL